MATIDHAEETANRTRIVLYVLGGLAVIAVLAVAISWFNRPPQMGADEDVFQTVDALYTAVRLQDEAKVAQCEKLLHSYREAGKLPQSSSEFLDRVIGRTRAGRWDSAAEQLYEFMLAQRREGAPPQADDKHRHGKPGKR